MLITGLIFIVILTLIVLALLRTGTLEERMVANARNRQMALQAAEAVLRDAEATLFPRCRASAPIDPFDASAFADRAATRASAGRRRAPRRTGGRSPGAPTEGWARPRLSASVQPAALHRRVPRAASGGQAGGICPRLLFRLTARGSGRDAAEVFVETMFWYQPLRFADGSCG